jgi:hypothetical protein
MEKYPVLMNTLFGQVAFTAGRQRYTWADVALAAKLWGDWAKGV